MDKKNTIVNVAHVLDKDCYTFESLLRKNIEKYNQENTEEPINLKDIAKIVDNFAKVARKALQELNNDEMEIHVSSSGRADIGKASNLQKQVVKNKIRYELGGNAIDIYLSFYQQWGETLV